ncbi:Facilitated trehalose transporter Tret1 [Chionoecetes opilio]|uniref:Facilitated trehalose transporter Tret1 n=1 Tax=Chionoecetes opilio TaxID=41210 RepID=A0A8J4XUH4_CHIOP|nr:Facilitated trehalose transporter Tret1 [Chionoecetes opilio]
MAEDNVPVTAALSPEKDDEEAKKISLKHVAILLVVALTSITQGAATKGWTAVLPRMQDDTHSFVDTDDDVAWLVSMTSIVGIFASLATGPLVEWAGPRRVLTIALGVSTALWLVMAFPPHKAVLFIARAGLVASVYSISTISLPLLAELSPKHVRGSISTLSEFAASIGMLYGYLMALLFPWQIATALCALTSAVMLLPMCFVPESPYWLVRRGRNEAAKASLQRLLGPTAEVKQQLEAITSMPAATQTSLMQQFTQLGKGRNARPVLLVLAFFVLRELGGRSCIMLYTVYIFRDAGVEVDAFTCTVLVGAVRVVCTCVTVSVLDRVGRRPLLVATAVLAAVAQAVCGLFLYLQVPGASWVPLVAVLVYTAAYGTGLGPIPWVYVGELVPSPVRTLGASLITACDALVVFGINLGFLKIISHIGLGVTFLSFAGLNFVIVIIVWLWIPESRGVSLQTLQGAFSTKTKCKAPQR